nr:hypothetical protein [uncultured Desulfobacter sp.]
MDDFVNRTNEYSYISKFIAQSRDDKNAVFILRAKQGVGKSSLMKEILKGAPPHIITLKTRYTSGTDSPSHPNEYLMNILSELSSVEEKHQIKSFKQFRREKILKQEFNRSNFIGIVQMIPFLGKFLSNHIASWFKLEEKFRVDFTVHPNTAEIYDYLKYIFDIKHVWLNIEDLQKIDQSSLKAIQRLMSETTGCCFFFEFTINDSNLSNYVDLVTQIEEAVETILEYELEKLCFKDIEKILKLKQREYEVLSLKRLYSNHSGNVKQILFYSITKAGSADAIKEKLIELSNDEKLLLSIVANYKEPIPRETILKIGQFLPDNLMSINLKTIQELTQSLDRELIELSHNIIRISHNSISTSILDLDEFAIANKFAFNAICQYLIKEIDNYQSIGQARGELFNLLRLFNMYDRRRLYDYINEIESVSQAYYYPDAAEVYLDSVTKELQPLLDENVQAQNIFKRIINAYYTIGSFEKAMELLEKTCQEETTYYRIYFPLILYRQGRYHDAVDYLSICMAKADSDQRVNLVFDILDLILSLTLNRKKNTSYLFDKLLNKTTYTKFFEYGFFLRLCEECNREDTEALVQKGIKHFQRFNNPIEAAKTKISLSAIVALKGRLKDGLLLLEEAEDVLKERLIESYNIKLNRSSIMMLMGSFTSDVERLLCDAEVLALQEFDLLMIRNNILAYYLESKEIEKAGTYAKRIESDIRNFPRASIKIATYYHLSKYYQVKGQPDYADLNHGKAIDCIDRLDSLRQVYWKKRLGLGQEEVGFHAILLKSTYHLNFSTFWWFSISEDF